jgi:hypothetical protein
MNQNPSENNTLEHHSADAAEKTKKAHLRAMRVLAAARAFQIGGPERIRLTRGEAALAKRAGGVALLSASLNLRSKQRLLEALTQATMSTLGSALVVCSERGE